MRTDAGYFLLVSRTSGYAPNEGQYFFSKSLHGPWKDMGLFTANDTNTTYNSQPTFLLPLKDHKNQTKYVYMGDQWNNPNNLPVSVAPTYEWLPIVISTSKDGHQAVRLADPTNFKTWNLDKYLRGDKY
jgi:hypothetical protein